MAIFILVFVGIVDSLLLNISSQLLILPTNIITIMNEYNNNNNNHNKEKKVESSMARSLPVENLLPQNVGSIISYLQ